eukprot:4905-Heterococcus_DN1.PRE.1
MRYTPAAPAAHIDLATGRAKTEYQLIERLAQQQLIELGGLDPDDVQCMMYGDAYVPADVPAAAATTAIANAAVSLRCAQHLAHHGFISFSTLSTVADCVTHSTTAHCMHHHNSRSKDMQRNTGKANSIVSTANTKQGMLMFSNAKTSKQLPSNAQLSTITGLSQTSSNGGGGAAVTDVVDRVPVGDTARKASTASDSTDDTATTDASDCAGDTDNAADSDANEEQASHMYSIMNFVYTLDTTQCAHVHTQLATRS